MAGSSARLMLATTSAARSVSPLWNVTPLRSVNVHARASSATLQRSASAGLYAPCSSTATSAS